MTLYKSRTSRVLIALVLSLALIFSFTPMLPSGQAKADTTVLTVEFGTFTPSPGSVVTIDPSRTVEYDQATLDAMALAASTSPSDKYLEYASSAFSVIQSNSYIPISVFNGGKEFTSGGKVTFIGDTTRDFTYQDLKNGNFFGDTTDTTAVTTNPTSAAPILSLATGKEAVVGTASTTSVSTFSDTAFTALVGLNRNDRLTTDLVPARYVKNVTKIQLLEPAPVENFKVYTKVGDATDATTLMDGNSGATVGTLAKDFTRAELEAIAENTPRGFLQFGTPVTVQATNSYVTIDKLLAEAGIVFNEGDELFPMDSTGFTTKPNSKQDYDYVSKNKYFFGGDTGTTRDETSPTEVGAVIALTYCNSTVTTGTAQTTLDDQLTYLNLTDQSRYLVGVSEENYLAGNFAGNRLITGPIELTVLKDEVDTIVDADVTLSEASFVATGSQIKPDVKVVVGGATLVKDAHYSVAYANNVAAGTGTVTVAGIGDTLGTVTKSFTITPKPAPAAVALKDADVSLAKTSYEETGKEIKPAVTVVSGGKTLVNNTDYTVAYKDNIKPSAKASVIVTGKGNYSGTVTKTFTITAKKVDTPATTSIKKAKVTLKTTKYTANGRQRKPAVTKVVLGKNTLKSGTDYTVKYGANKVGQGSVTITGKGAYKDSVKKTFTINPRGVTLKSVSAGKRSSTVKWNKAKDAVTGYQIAYKIKGAKKFKTVKVKGVKKVSSTVKRLTSGKAYQIKVRTYKTSGGKTYYSKYSKVKTTKKIKK